MQNGRQCRMCAEKRVHSYCGVCFLAHHPLPVRRERAHVCKLKLVCRHLNITWFARECAVMQLLRRTWQLHMAKCTCEMHMPTVPNDRSCGHMTMIKRKYISGYTVVSIAQRNVVRSKLYRTSLTSHATRIGSIFFCCCVRVFISCCY